jgi:hypothetical protein
MQKRCSKCHIIKPVSEFYIRPERNSYRPSCKQCEALYRSQTKPRLKQYKRNLYLENKESILSDNKKYYRENRDKIRKTQREYFKNRYASDINFRLSSIIRKRMRSTITEQNAEKMHTSIELLGCTIEEARLHIESKFQPGMTWDNNTHDGWHIDHIRPCASFDLTDPKQQKQCFHYTNLQPLWSMENLSKGAKVPSEIGADSLGLHGHPLSTKQ